MCDEDFKYSKAEGRVVEIKKMQKIESDFENYIYVYI